LKSFKAVALEGFPLVKAGDDMGKLIVEAADKNGVALEDGDVVVVAQKVFSKAEKRVIGLEDVVVSSDKTRELARKTRKSGKFVELVLRESKRVIKSSHDILLVEDRRGLVCINAGIDKSNIEGRRNFALLPENPDASAEECRARIKKLTGKNVALIICDTFSRPFRRGQVNFSIGFAGIKPFKDYRGKKDLFGYVLKVKNVAIVDELAAAAELLMGQGKEALPVVIFKGLDNQVELCEECDSNALHISEQEDLFRDAL